MEKDSKLLKIHNNILPDQLDILNGEIRKIRTDLYRIKKKKMIKFNQNHHDNINDINNADLINEEKEEDIEDDIIPSKIKKKK